MGIFDMAIIGAGPAGLSAAINAKIRNKSFILFGLEEKSSKIEKAKKISNYPGLPDISGPELNSAFLKQAEALEIEITKKQVSAVYKNGDIFMLSSGSEVYEAKAVILALGAKATRDLPGEREFSGRGVSYCATCDGNFYRGKEIAVICESQEHEDEVQFLADLAKTLYYFPLFKSRLTGENIILQDSKPAAISGDLKAEALELENGKKIKTDGIFILKNVGADVLLSGLKMEKGSVAVDHGMSTNIEGCFACGDCTGYPYQIAKAVGEGNTAAHGALRYLSGK